MYGYKLDMTEKVETVKPVLFSLGDALPGGGNKHNQPVSAVAWHPDKAMFASGCSSMCLWTPPPPSGSD